MLLFRVDKLLYAVKDEYPKQYNYLINDEFSSDDDDDDMINNVDHVYSIEKVYDGEFGIPSMFKFYLLLNNSYAIVIATDNGLYLRVGMNDWLNLCLHDNSLVDFTIINGPGDDIILIALFSDGYITETRIIDNIVIWNDYIPCFVHAIPKNIQKKVSCSKLPLPLCKMSHSRNDRSMMFTTSKGIHCFLPKLPDNDDNIYLWRSGDYTLKGLTGPFPVETWSGNNIIQKLCIRQSYDLPIKVQYDHRFVIFLTRNMELKIMPQFLRRDINNERMLDINNERMLDINNERMLDINNERMLDINNEVSDFYYLESHKTIYVVKGGELLAYSNNILPSITNISKFEIIFKVDGIGITLPPKMSCDVEIPPSVRTKSARKL